MATNPAKPISFKENDVVANQDCKVELVKASGNPEENPSNKVIKIGFCVIDFILLFNYTP